MNYKLKIKIIFIRNIHNIVYRAVHCVVWSFDFLTQKEDRDLVDRQGTKIDKRFGNSGQSIF